MLRDSKSLQLALSCLGAQVGAIGRAAYFPVRDLVTGGSPPALPVPALVLLASDGHAVAWYGDGRPFVVHPALVDLMGMHGLVRRLVAAA